MAVLGATTVAWATNDADPQSPTALGITVGASPVCPGTTVALTATECPTNGTLRWSTGQTTTAINVAPTQTTVYSLSCSVSVTSTETRTITVPVSTTGSSSTATSSTAVSTSVVTTTNVTTNTTTASATVQVYAGIVLNASISNVSCNNGKDGQVLFAPTGGSGSYQYQFSDLPIQVNNQYGGLRAGSYPIVIKDSRGCTLQSSVQITQPAALSLTITVVGTKCTGGSDGGIVAVASGGNGGYRYILNSGTPQLTGTFVDLKANTTYNLGVSDKNTCVLFQDVKVGAPIALDVKLTPQLTRCTGTTDGSVSVSVTGGTAPYQYQLGGGAFQTGAQFTGLAAKAYDITVRDANGCLTNQPFTIGQPSPLQLTATSKQVNCFGPTSGTIAVTPSGGTGAVTYQLTSNKVPQTSNVFTGVGVGDYTVVGTDANGCTSLVSVTVTQAQALKVQATPVPATCCVCPTGAVNLISTGGSGILRQFQVAGQAYQVGSQIGGLRPNSYLLRVIDEAGCTDSVRAVITDGQALSLSVASVKDIQCKGSTNGEAVVQVAGGKRPFTYYWTTERKDTLKTYTPSQAGLSEGTYTVSVIDSNRCTTSTAFVNIKALFLVPAKPVLAQSGGTLNVVEPPAGIQWYVRTGTDPGTAVPNATASTLTPFASGSYYVIVTNNGGCASPPSEAISFVLTAPEPDAGLSVRVVPNPIIDRLRLEIEQVERSAIQVQLLDATGRSVRAYEIPAFTGKKQAEWPISGIATGTYLLKVNAESRQSVIRVLVQ
ncbi:hypothetical protein GCM10027592_30400 [Spirosoma flavus]